MDIILVLKVVVFEIQMVKRNEISAGLGGTTLHFGPQKPGLVCVLSIPLAYLVEKKSHLLFETSAPLSTAYTNPVTL